MGESYGAGAECLYSSVKSTKLGTSAVLIVGPNEHRTALVFTPQFGGASYTIGTDASVTTTKGLTIEAGGGSLHLTAHEHGDIVKRGWWGVAGAVNTVIGYLETLRK